MQNVKVGHYYKIDWAAIRKSDSYHPNYAKLIKSSINKDGKVYINFVRDGVATISQEPEDYRDRNSETVEVPIGCLKECRTVKIPSRVLAQIISEEVCNMLREYYDATNDMFEITYNNSIMTISLLSDDYAIPVFWVQQTLSNNILDPYGCELMKPQDRHKILHQGEFVRVLLPDDLAHIISSNNAVDKIAKQLKMYLYKTGHRFSRR